MKAIITVAIMAITMAAQAQPFKLATGEPLHSKQQELKVKGRNGILIRQKLSFGDYYTTKVKRSGLHKWTGATGFPGFIWKEHIEGREALHFNLTDGTHTSEAAAVTNITTNDLLIGSTGNATRLPGAIVPIFTSSNVSTNVYSASIVTEKDGTPWQLFLDNIEGQARRRQPAGYVVRGEEFYTIEPIWQIEKKDGTVAETPFGSPGFQVVNSKNEVLAALSLMDNGKVYLMPGNGDEQFLMANVCAALLLQSVH